MNKIDDTYQSEIYGPLINKLENICKRPYLGQKEFKRLFDQVQQRVYSL